MRIIYVAVAAVSFVASGWYDSWFREGKSKAKDKGRAKTKAAPDNKGLRRKFTNASNSTRRMLQDTGFKIQRRGMLQDLGLLL